jgi:hypothetical protein
VGGTEDAHTCPRPRGITKCDRKKIAVLKICDRQLQKVGGGGHALGGGGHAHHSWRCCTIRRAPAALSLLERNKGVRVSSGSLMALLRLSQGSRNALLRLPQGSLKALLRLSIRRDIPRSLARTHTHTRSHTKQEFNFLLFQIYKRPTVSSVP